MRSDEILKICSGADLSYQPLMVSYLDSIAKMEDAAIQRRLLNELLRRQTRMAARIDSLLRNTLPSPVADEITYSGSFTPAQYHCTIMFSDFLSFTALAERIDPAELVIILHEIFSRFDDITAGWNGTKIKTMGDSYMSVFGAPDPFDGHAERAVRAGLAMLAALENFNEKNPVDMRMRVGIHTGTVVAGVVGKHRMQFDVFGDDVNIASRFESSGAPGRVSVSENTYKLTEGIFQFEERGMVACKNKGLMKAFFVVGDKEVASYGDNRQP